MNKSISLTLLLLVFFEYTFGALVAQSNLHDSTLLIRLVYREMVYGLILLFIFYKYRDRLHLYNKILALFVVLYSFVGLFVEASVNHFILIFPSLILMHYAFFEFTYNQNRISTTLNSIFILTAIFIIMQFLGIHEVVYFHQNFTQDLSSAASFLQTSGYLPNQQHRPHGIFPNTIYLTLFVILYYGHLVLVQNKRKSMYIFSGLVFPLIGSTTVVLLLLASLFAWKINRQILYFLVSSLFSMMFLYFLFPLFFEMNFNFETFLISFNVRTDMNRANSFFTSSLGASLMFLAVLCVYLIYTLVSKFMGVKRGAISYNLFLLFILVAPLVVHPILLDTRYGLLCGMVASFFVRKKISNS